MAVFKPSTSTSATVAGPAGGPMQSPTASGLVNSPIDSLAPTNTPAAWGLTQQTLDAPLYAGSTTTSVKVSALKRNQLLGQVADKLNIKTKPGTSLEEQVVAALAKQYKIPTTTSREIISTVGAPTGKNDQAVATGDRPDTEVLSDVLDKMGLGKSTSIAAPKAAGVLGISPALGKAKTTKTNVDLQDPVTLGNVAQKLGVSVNGSVDETNQQTTTVGKAAMQIYGMKSSQIAGLQALLWEGGYYDEDVEGEGGVAGPDAKKITPGNLDPYTMKAFGSLLAQTASSGSKLSWKDALNTAAGTNQVGGSGNGLTIQDLVDEGTTGTGPSTTAPKVTLATPTQMMTTLQQYFESKLGRMPTTAELDEFTTQYDAQQTAGSKQLDPNTFLIPDSTTGVDIEPGVPTAASAATQFAQSDNTEYGAHQIANAGSLLLSAMRESGGLGANPNITQAG